MGKQGVGGNVFDMLDLEQRGYENDCERYGTAIAEANKQRQEELLQNMKMIEKPLTLDDILNISYLYEFDKDTNCDLYFFPEVDSKGNVITDEENKCVKFINQETGKTMIKNYE